MNNGRSASEPKNMFQLDFPLYARNEPYASAEHLTLLASQRATQARGAIFSNKWCGGTGLYNVSENVAYRCLQRRDSRKTIDPF